MKFKIGDVVKLKSGGPVMTIVGVSKDGDCVCTWFYEGREPGVRVFPSDALVDAEKATR